jgi:hypothetical protein
MKISVKKYLFMFFLLVSSLYSCLATADIDVDTKECIANTSVKAKSIADIKAKEIIARLDKETAATGGGVGLGCAILSIAVLGLDGGALTLTCAAAGAVGAATYYGSQSDRNAELAKKVFLQVFEQELKNEKLKCYEHTIKNF